MSKVASLRPSPTLPPAGATPSTAIRVLLIATFCSGGCALLLEQIYEKYLSTLLGASRPAATTVLATFFLGLALGGLACPKKTAGATRRLAILEFFVSGWAVLVGLGFFPSCAYAAEWLATAGGSSSSLAAARFALALLWILPPTIAMGAQLPTLSAALEIFAARTPGNLARFYSVNLLGGLAFTIFAPVVLFQVLGAAGALWFAAGLSAVVGTGLWFGLPTSPERGRPQDPVETAPERIWLPEVLLAALSGFVFFALEVIWFHLISSVLGASTYSFSILLATVLLGLALSGYWLSRVAGERAADPGALLLHVLARLLPVMAVSSAAWPHLARVMSSIQTRVQLESFWAGETLKFVVITVAVVPSAIGLGLVFPLLLRGIDGPDAPTSRRIGWICSANVVGCVFGALVAGYGLISSVGSELALQMLWSLVAVAGVALGVRQWRRPASLGASPCWAVAGLLAVIFLPRWDRLELTRGIGVYLFDGMPRDARLTYFHEDHHAGFVSVVETGGATGQPPTRTLLQNGKFDADNQSQMPAQIGFGLVGALHAPAFERALVIGCGSGQTADVIEGFGFRHVEVVEMSPGHLQAAQEFFRPINAHLWNNPRVSLIVEDGRNWLLRSRSSYDLIQVELSSVWFAGATNLYSREFYELVHRRLSPGGVLVQWLQLHHLTEREITTIIGTIQQTLPVVSIWRVGPQACILASSQPQSFNETALNVWLTSPRFATERSISQLHSTPALTASGLIAPQDVQALLGNSAFVANTDRNRWLELQAPKYYLSRRDHLTENLNFFRTAGPAR